MKYYLLYICYCCMLFSCQKNIHWDIDSKGILSKDNDGNCLPVFVSGLYVADSAITEENYLTVDVDVTDIGKYSIYTDSINGIVFKASGEFTSNGMNHVKLFCTGKPIEADTSYFTIYYENSICNAAIIIKSNAIPQAKFSLEGAPQNCLNDSIFGRYTAETTLDTSNKILLNVNVITPGRYTISTATVNGYSFSASGVFEHPGLQKIPIYPNGIPLKDGIDIFEIITGSVSSCKLLVKVYSDQAQFTLQSASGKCMNDTVLGTYIKNIELDTICQVQVGVYVSFPGKYSIQTNTVNGYSFTGGGIFADTGIQVIQLYGKGIPVNAGTDVFTITTGTATCTFNVVVLSGVILAAGYDLFPLTNSSYWTYQDLFDKNNFFQKHISGDSLLNGNIYAVMKETDSYNQHNSYSYRKKDGNYFEYARTDKYTNAISYAKATYTDLLFLKENASQNEYWESPEYKDITTFNQAIVLKYGYKCIKTNAVVTINNKAFADVWIIEMRPQIRTLTEPWSYTNEIYTCYYARGVGIIYSMAVNNSNFKKAEMQLNTWMVK